VPATWYNCRYTRKGRLEYERFLVEGDRSVRQIINNNPSAVEEIITTGELPHIYDSYPQRYVTESQLRSISQAKTPQGPLAVIMLPTDIYTDNPPDNTGNKILLLEDIQDPGNVGTLIRTAAALDFVGVILSNKSADPLSPKCVQSTAGTVFSVWLRRTASYIELVKSLKQKGYTVIATDVYGTDEPSILNNHGRQILALGNEASGLSPALLELSDHRLVIPVNRNKAESLNVAACGAICMYLSTCIK